MLWYVFKIWEKYYPWIHNLARAKTVWVYNQRGLLILERILIFDEEGVLSMMPPKAAQYPTEEKI